MIIFCLHYHNKLQTYMYSTVPESVTFLIINRRIVFRTCIVFCIINNHLINNFSTLSTFLGVKTKGSCMLHFLVSICIILIIINMNLGLKNN